MFTVEVHPDGIVLYNGQYNARVRGPCRWNIDRAAATALFSLAACGHPESWQRSYSWDMKDAPVARVSVDLGGDAGAMGFWDNPTCKEKRRSKTDPYLPPFVQKLPDDPEGLCALEEGIYATTGVSAYAECRGDDWLAGRCADSPHRGDGGR